MEQRKDTYNFEFYPDGDDRRNIRLSYDVPGDGVTCGELQRMCKAFALALGYAPSSVEECFGEDVYDD